jgi:hypothetical protein
VKRFEVAPQRLQTRVVEALPDLLLPEPVEVLDHPLEALLQGRRKDWRDLQGQAQTHHAPHDVRMIMPSLEARIVIELRVRREALAAPMRLQKFHNLRGVRLRGRPGAHRRAEQGPTGENLAEPEAFQRQILNHIKAVELRFAGPHRRQIPAGRRRRPPHARPGVQQAVTGQDAHARHGPKPLLLQPFGDGVRPMKPERALLFQLLAQDADALLQLLRRFVGHTPGRLGPRRPIHLFQRRVTRALHPPLDRAQRHAKPPRHRPHGLALPHRLHPLCAPFHLRFSFPLLPSLSSEADANVLSLA